MATYQFLTDDWIAAAREVQERHHDKDPGRIAPVKMNLVVDKMPFGPQSLDAHIDTTSGDIDLDFGHLDSPDVTVHLSYDLAKSILVDGDGRAAIGAFFTKKLRIDGDLAKLLAFQAGGPSARQNAVTEDIRAITA